MAVALNHTTSRDCKFTKCIQTFMGKMAIVALSTEWHWRRGMRKRLPLSSSLSSLLQRIFLCQAGSLPAKQQMPCQLLCWQPCRRHQVDTCGTFQRLPINSNTFSGDAKAIFCCWTGCQDHCSDIWKRWTCTCPTWSVGKDNWNQEQTKKTVVLLLTN